MLRPSRRGFTLLELIVVIVVLGILAAIAVPTFAKVIESSRKQATLNAAQGFAREVRALAAFSELRTVGELEALAMGSEVGADMPAGVDRISGSSATDGTVTIRTGGYKVSVNLRVGAPATFGTIVPGP